MCDRALADDALQLRHVTGQEVVLIPITAALAHTVGDEAAFESSCGATLGVASAAVRDVVDATRAFHVRISPPPEYGGYLAADARTRQVIGGCGYKGGPDAAGEVEIAYGTFAPFEGRGYAKAMARALVEHAVALGAPRLIAHTLPEVNASGSILRGLGFRQVGTVIADPEDGPVWRWELPTDVADGYR